ncbi:MAG: zf-TFIIB domain-containing protein [Candidatus Aureabacteria bacterium]|nr:zf-TFIIB domain-containing protein [Candidatus Auribacterota bacterium]
MDCPRCMDPMIVLELKRVEIDYCPECGGIWLDEGELEMLLEDSDEKNSVLQSLIVAGDVKEEVRRCPVCSKSMEKVLCGKGEKKILIDRCKKMHGLWFDKGELDDVLRMGSIDKKGLTVNLLKDMFSKTI